jgi:hypothetical protein
MPVARVEINGRIARIEVPAGTTPEQARRMALEAVGGDEKGIVGSVTDDRPDTRPKSFWQGLLEGAVKAANNAQWALDTITGKELARKIGGQPTASQLQRAQLKQQQEKSRYRGSTAGRITGGVIGTLPTMLVPGGPIAQGAAAGGLLTDDPNDIGGLARDVAIGGVMGKVGDVAGKGLSRVIGGRTAVASRAPKLPPAKQAYKNAVAKLDDAGVTMTPGQRVGGVARRVEDASDSLGILAPAPKAKAIASEGFNRGAYNEVLKPLGVRVPDNLSPGHDAVGKVLDMADEAYTAAARPLTLQFDQPLEAAINKRMTDAAARMGPDEVAQLNANVANILTWRQSGGPLQGPQVTQTLGNLRKVASGARASGKQTLADDLWGLHDDVEAAMMRSSPQGVREPFHRAREAVRRGNILADAVSKAKDGIMTPGNFNTAVSRLGYGTTRKSLARQNAPMQKFANAAGLVLPDKLPNSGTADRGLLMALLGGGAPAIIPGAPAVAAPILGGAYGMYIPQVNKAAQRLTLHGRNLPPARVAAGKMLSEYSKPLTTALPALAVGAAPRKKKKKKDR